MLQTAEDFFKKHDKEGNGFILKAPHVEHGQGYQMKWIRPVDSSTPPPTPLPLLKAATKCKKRRKNNTSVAKKKQGPKVLKPNHTSLIDQLKKFLMATMSESTSLNNRSGNQRKQCDIFPYLILQERMKYDNESKVILLNGQARYITSVDRASGLIHATKFPAVSKKRLFDFAEEAFRELRLNCPYFCCEPMVRVDVFNNSENKLVVNEFESLSSNYSCASHVEQSQIYMYLVDFWVKKLQSFLLTHNKI